MTRSIETAQRDMRAAEMRSRSMTYQQIADALEMSVGAAYKAVQRAFASIPTEEAVEAKRQELDKLDRIERHLLGVMEREHIKVDHGKVIRDDETGERILDDGPGVQAASTLLRVQERRTRLLGTDAPQRQVTTVITESIVDAEIARLERELAEYDDSRSVLVETEEA